MLKKANLLDSQRGQGCDSLPANPLTAETVLARTSEVRKMRELMFRADAKAKRLAKIKSKTYRRLKKKQQQKLAEKFEAEEDSAEDEEKRLKREVERARERATLKHKNAGKWAKAMKARGELDEDQRQEVLEMLQRGEDLRRKIHAKGSKDSEGEGEDDSDDDTGDEGQVRASAFDEVARVVEDEVPEHSKKSLFSMKFMKDAMARDHKKAQDIADEFLKDLAGSDGEALSDASTDDMQDQPKRTNGRFSFRPGAPVRAIASLALITHEILPFFTVPTNITGAVAAGCRWRCGIRLSDFIPHAFISVDCGPPCPVEGYYRTYFHRLQRHSFIHPFRSREPVVEWSTRLL